MFNPLMFKPKADRLTIAVRGPAGSGKSTFAASAQELENRLLFLDLEGKSRLLAGATNPNPPFDAVSLRTPNLLPPTLDWLLEGDGRSRYGTVALDSWAVYFADSYDRAIRASGKTELNAEQEQALQVTVQNVLRRLCFESGLNVIITDVIAARNKEASEANELGRVIPLTASGLEYMVDIVADLDLIMTDGIRPTRVLTITKSNIATLPVGFTLENPTFNRLLEAAGIETSKNIPDTTEVEHTTTKPDITIEEIHDTATEYGFTASDVNLVITKAFRKRSVEQLTQSERTEIIERMKRAPKK